MGTTDSASNPVACLRSNCVPFWGPTSAKYRGLNANRKATNRTFDGVTTDPLSSHGDRGHPKQHQLVRKGSQTRRNGVKTNQEVTWTAGTHNL